MNRISYQTVILRFIVLLAVTVALSHLSDKAWGDKAETLPKAKALVMTDPMTVSDFIKVNGIPLSVAKEAFALQSSQDLQKNLLSIAPSRELKSKVSKAMALHHEESSKNWIKIPLKFGLWFLFLGWIFFLLRRRRLAPGPRKGLYLAALMIFGVILGADPSPMGTIKDAIALYGAQGVIFKPRVVALSIFLATVIIANKFICGWGCQLGVLQDLVFRLNRNEADNRGVLRQYKPPFWFTNGSRIMFFLIFSSIALLWATDIIALVDPFKVFKPSQLSKAGWVFLVFLLITGLFIYRPWCQFFCPFGLLGWLVEKVSLFKINVNHETCTHCEACSTACPSTVMIAILRQDRIRPDCFACGACINACPTNSISFALGRKKNQEFR
jgi:polyferredoxin